VAGANWYKDGTASATNGSTTVIGSGTLWSVQARTGDLFGFYDGNALTRLYEINSVTDNTHIELAAEFDGTTVENSTYAIVRNMNNTMTSETNAMLQSFLREWNLALQQNMKGDPGDPGTDGLNFRTLVSAPSAALGVDDEAALNVTTLNLYRKEAGTWVLRANIKGPKGDDGTAGAKIYISNVDPVIADGVAGDVGINVTSGDVFQRLSTGWSLQGNIKGPKGDDGDTGDTGPKGDKGDPAYWFAPSSAPGVSLGSDGDMALVGGDSGNWYRREGGVWVLKGCLKGVKGDQGNPGGYGVIWVGVWASDTEYTARDGVYYNGSSFVALQTNTGQTPPDPATGGNDYWQVVARAGLDGEGSGDMTKADYDSNADGKVNAADAADTATYATAAGRATDADSADSVLWSAIDGIPDTFSPSAHALSAHESSTLAELNAKISDADLASTATATTSANGLMSAADKTKLDGLGDGLGEDDVIEMVLVFGGGI